VIEVVDLAKSYGQVHAVRGISFTVDEGEILAVLGPNGAGKTTTVEILEGFRERDSGSATVLGMDPATGGTELRQRIGIVLQECGVEPYLTVAEVLTMNAGFYRRSRPVDEVISLVGLEDKANARVKSLSGGQKRRLDVALGIIPDPELLFLDEPTTGFDPTARRQAWEMVKSLKQLGKTVLLTTHYMDEAQALADRVIVIADGQIVAEGPPESIGGRADADAQIRFALPAGVGIAQLPVAADQAGDGMAIVTTNAPTTVLHTLTSWALQNGGELARLSVTRPSLDDIYVSLTAPPDGDR
jgi:ABC-2 type transport system ATP-binding protein